MHYKETMKTHLKWTIQEIALTFVHENLHLGLNTTQIKQHLKMLNVKKIERKVMFVQHLTK
jgi:hypothetical protein